MGYRCVRAGKTMIRIQAVWSRRSVMAIILAGTAACAVLLLPGCKVQTRYSLEVDVLSYIPEDERAREWTADDDENGERYRVIFLPYSEQLFRESEPIAAEFQKGLEVDLPVVEDPGVDDLTLSFQIDADVFNRSESDDFKEAAFRLLAAPHSVENVYADGTLMLTFDATDIPAGESRTLAGTRTIRRGDPGFEILAAGKARLGLEGLFRSDPGVTMEYVLNVLRVKISIRPFSMLP